MHRLKTKIFRVIVTELGEYAACIDKWTKSRQGWCRPLTLSVYLVNIHGWQFIYINKHKKLKFVKLIQCNNGATINSTTNAYMYVFTNYKKSHISNCLTTKYHMTPLSFIPLIASLGFSLSGTEKARGVQHVLLIWMWYDSFRYLIPLIFQNDTHSELNKCPLIKNACSDLFSFFQNWSFNFGGPNANRD